MLLLAMLPAGLPVAAAPPLFVGVLEQIPDHPLAVRVAFRKTGEGWSAMPSDCPVETCLATIGAQYPAQIDWTVAFDGHAVGMVTARTPARYDAYGDVGQQTVLRPERAPHVGRSSTKFGGWPGDAPVRRPLVVVSQPNTADPDGWKPAPLDARSAAILRRAFRAHFPLQSNCRDPVENKASPWSYRDPDIRISNSYADRRGRRIANLALKPNRCDGPVEGGFESQTFGLVDGTALLLDRGLTLVDAGDYDGDGRAELVFQIARYNRGGYALVYDDLRRHADFVFSYH